MRLQLMLRLGRRALLALVAAAAAACAGCASHAEIADADDSRCRSYGAAPGSDAYVQCRMTQDARRDAMRRAILSSPPVDFIVPR